KWMRRESMFDEQAVWRRCLAAYFMSEKPICKRSLFASHISYLRFEIFSGCTSKSSAVLRGEDFDMFSLDIHPTLFKKKAENVRI
ncbi:MAG: hypothetical protein II943_00665, partial [Victivallales bacterium]|nr:hypothetical protein [Victivallales bacterium]